ncbi:hypothetical protein [Bacillus sp. CECT 9360]|uniref:hypothetical protein n=1 Tax=Bacillus sp. CECT 9360 TaxID=2845821 RepID=UPI001E34EA5E|nr:hypothetical protein [Bacillus sp. CECT 9360]CAH0345871.1 hypothetical protein BCI9360_02173 [Bacillus sp. CECT 9360]
MNKENQSHMIHSQAVNKQLDELEARNASNEKNKKGSTNEIQPIATDDELTQ